MVQNAFDPNFDEDNEVYAVNTVAFHFMYQPVRVKRGELVRIYLVNIVELDPINSFHVHGNFFHRFPTGTVARRRANTRTRSFRVRASGTCSSCAFPYTGKYMFHAHKSEFAGARLDGLLRSRGVSRCCKRFVLIGAASVVGHRGRVGARSMPGRGTGPHSGGRETAVAAGDACDPVRSRSFSSSTSPRRLRAWRRVILNDAFVDFHADPACARRPASCQRITDLVSVDLG